jgi:hypothetical protein
MNGQAIIIAMPAVLVGVGMKQSMHVSDVVAYCGAGAFAVMADLVLRSITKTDTGDSHWIDPRAGGHFFFVPIWCWGLVWIVYNWGAHAKWW